MRPDMAEFIQTDKTASEFVELVNSGELDLPLPGSGSTQDRWFAFEALGGRDLSLARLSEGHADAVAILAELGGPEPSEGSISGRLGPHGHPAQAWRPGRSTAAGG